MEKHFTATVFIIKDQKVLLIHHRKFQKWLPPGGHLDPNETPPEAAIREAKEETGLDVAIIPQENIWVDRWNAKSFERPYLCMLEHIPAFGNKDEHYHMDFIYLANPVGGQEKENQRETLGLKWFSLEEIQRLDPDKEIFAETQQTLNKIFTSIPKQPEKVAFG
jgi:8-oxo-dGTP pyrophosphatase MutT (NUDIX family)